MSSCRDRVLIFVPIGVCHIPSFCAWGWHANSGKCWLWTLRGDGLYWGADDDTLPTGYPRWQPLESNWKPLETTLQETEPGGWENMQDVCITCTVDADNGSVRIAVNSLHVDDERSQVHTIHGFPRGAALHPWAVLADGDGDEVTISPFYTSASEKAAG